MEIIEVSKNKFRYGGTSASGKCIGNIYNHPDVKIEKYHFSFPELDYKIIFEDVEIPQNYGSFEGFGNLMTYKSVSRNLFEFECSQNDRINILMNLFHAKVLDKRILDLRDRESIMNSNQLIEKGEIELLAECYYGGRRIFYTISIEDFIDAYYSVNPDNKSYKADKTYSDLKRMQILDTFDQTQTAINILNHLIHTQLCNQ